VFDGGNLIEDLSVAADASTSASLVPSFLGSLFSGDRRENTASEEARAAQRRERGESGNECGVAKVKPRGAAGEREIPAERPVHYA